MKDLDFSKQETLDIHVEVFDLFPEDEVLIDFVFSDSDESIEKIKHLTDILLENNYSFKVEYNRIWDYGYLKEKGLVVDE